MFSKCDMCGHPCSDRFHEVISRVVSDPSQTITRPKPWETVVDPADPLKVLGVRCPKCGTLNTMTDPGQAAT